MSTKMYDYGNLTHNGDPRVGKLIFENLKMSNFRGLPPFYHILGQTLPRIVQTFSFEDENNYRDEV